MSRDDRPDTGTGTIVHSFPHLMRRRLKQGLIPQKTVISLRVERGPEAGRVFDVSKGGDFLIGRAGADISLHDEKVSRKHAELGVYGPDAYQLQDLASTNGTLVNGKPIDRAKLNHGDLIRMGETLLVFEVIEAGPVPVEEP